MALSLLGHWLLGRIGGQIGKRNPAYGTGVAAGPLEKGEEGPIYVDEQGRDVTKEVRKYGTEAFYTPPSTIQQIADPQTSSRVIAANMALQTAPIETQQQQALIDARARDLYRRAFPDMDEATREIMAARNLARTSQRDINVETQAGEEARLNVPTLTAQGVKAQVQNSLEQYQKLLDYGHPAQEAAAITLDAISRQSKSLSDIATIPPQAKLTLRRVQDALDLAGGEKDLRQQQIKTGIGQLAADYELIDAEKEARKIAAEYGALQNSIGIGNARTLGEAQRVQALYGIDAAKARQQALPYETAADIASAQYRRLHGVYPGLSMRDQPTAPLLRNGNYYNETNPWYADPLRMLGNMPGQAAANTPVNVGGNVAVVPGMLPMIKKPLLADIGGTQTAAPPTTGLSTNAIPVAFTGATTNTPAAAASAAPQASPIATPAITNMPSGVSVGGTSLNNQWKAPVQQPGIFGKMLAPFNRPADYYKQVEESVQEGYAKDIEKRLKSAPLFVKPQEKQWLEAWRAKKHAEQLVPSQP